MNPKLPERRYSDDETRRIFEDAAEIEAGRRQRRSEGHTLEQLRDIAREVGIDPSAVERAAANLDSEAGTNITARNVLGLPLLLHEELTLPRRLTDEEMQLVAQQAQRVAGRPGPIQRRGDWSEWRDTNDRLYVGAVRGADQTRIRVVTDQVRDVVAGATGVGVLAVLNLPTVLSGVFLTPVDIVMRLLLLGIATWGATALFARTRAGVARRNMRELLGIIEDTVDTGPSPF